MIHAAADRPPAGRLQSALTAALPAGASLRRQAVLGTEVAWEAAVAIPAKREAAYLGPCLAATAASVRRGRAGCGIVVLVNDSADGSYELARDRLAGARVPHLVLDVDFTPGTGSAGLARRLAMDAAASVLQPAGLLLTTDADSRPRPDWLAAAEASVARGADVVCGEYDIDDGDWRGLPPPIRHRLALERLYARLTTELHALLDPPPQGRDPRLLSASGASLAVRLPAYRDIGGMPPVGSGEDRAFVAAAMARDWRVVHAEDVRVITSGRLSGRAAGGMAATLTAWIGAGDGGVCDQALEPACAAALRAWARCRLRAAHAGRLSADRLLRLLGLDPAGTALGGRYFGEAWARIETASPRLVRRPLTPQALAAELPLMARLIAWLRTLCPSGRSLAVLRHAGAWVGRP